MAQTAPPGNKSAPAKIESAQSGSPHKGWFARLIRLPFPPGHNFWNECAFQNLPFSHAFLWMGLSMESIMLFFYIAQKHFSLEASIDREYMYLYVSMIAACLIALPLTRLYRGKPEKLMSLQVALVLFLAFWSALFSCLDINHGFSSYLFVIMAMIHSLAFRLEPLAHCTINVCGYLFYATLILRSDLPFAITFAELINPLFVVIIACVIISVNSRNFYAFYCSRQLIAKQNSKLQYYANHDFLTRICNRKVIMEHLDSLLSRRVSTIACMMVDIDDFKRYNDSYGHVAGDRCLIRLARLMQSFALSRGGKVGRYGGEEFLLVLADVSAEYAQSAAEELVRLVSDRCANANTLGSCRSVTISIGLYMETDPSRATRQSIVFKADCALYRAKREGKNRAHLYQDSENALNVASPMRFFMDTAR